MAIEMLMILEYIYKTIHSKDDLPSWRSILQQKCIITIWLDDTILKFIFAF